MSDLHSFDHTTNPVFQDGTYTADNRLEMRAGLIIYQNLFPPLVTMPFTLQTNLEAQLWEGALNDGTTKVRSGPDYNRVNTALILPDTSQRGTGAFLSVFVGCYATEEEAKRASTGLDMLLMNMGRGHGMEVFKRNVASFQTLWSSGERTLEQLAQSLRLCGECGTHFSSKKCKFFFKNLRSYNAKRRMEYSCLTLSIRVLCISIRDIYD